ncbi:MAG: TonB-dependent receptor domain-containing protein [Mongoliitalea sp.]
MKLLGFLVFFFVFLLPVRAQVVWVYDAQTKQGLEFVLISLGSSQNSVQTDSEGKADISLLGGKNENVRFRLFGYQLKQLSWDELLERDFTVAMQVSELTLQRAVVSATRWTQSRQQVPNKISQISKEEQLFLNPQTAADLLNISGDVFIQKSQQGGGSPMIRGFSTNRLLYAVDGVRMNTAIFRSGNLHNVISLDPFAIENTEVFFGPGSIIYGSDAIGAVMSFETLKPVFQENKQFKVDGNVSLRGNTANKEQTGHVHLRYGNNRWAGVSSFSRYNFGDSRMGTRGPEEFLRPTLVERVQGQDVIVENANPLIQIPSGYQQSNFMQKLALRTDSGWNFQYAFHFSETSNFPRYDRLIRLRSNGLPQSAEWMYGPQIWAMHHFNVQHSNTTSSLYDQLSINLAYQRFEESRIDRNFRSSIRREREERVDAYSLNVDLTKTVSKAVQLFYGLEGVLNDVRSEGTDVNIDTGIKGVGPARYPNATWSSGAAYLTSHIQLTKNSLIQGGLRYNIFALNADFTNNLPFYPLPFEQTSLQNSAFIGSLGYVFSSAEGWVMHANVSKGFRAPNVDDIGKFFDSEPGAVLVPNPALQAEDAYNAEVNIGKVIKDRVLFDVTAYYTYLNNALVRRMSQFNGQDSIFYDGTLSQVLSLQNAAFVQIQGLQVGLEYKVSKSFTLHSKLNIQRGIEEMEDGERSPSRHAPPTFGLTRLDYQRKNLRLQLFAEYAGSFTFEQLPLEERAKPELYAVDALGRPFSPSWATLNFKAQYRFPPWVTINAGLENLTDVRYRTYSSGIAAPGRNFVLSINIDF